MTDCICGHSVTKNSMCHFCGTVYDKDGNIDIEDTKDRVFEFIVFSSDLSFFNRWRMLYDTLRKDRLEYIAFHKFRNDVQKFLTHIGEEDVFKMRTKVIRSGQKHNISEKILMELGYAL